MGLDALIKSKNSINNPLQRNHRANIKSNKQRVLKTMLDINARVPTVLLKCWRMDWEG